MSTVLVAAILLGFIAFFVLLFIQIEKRKKSKHMNGFLALFRELGSLHHLSFSSQEILPHSAIGLDGIHRKVLILYNNNESTISHELVDLNEVKACMIKKVYGTISAGIKNGKLEQFLEKLSLSFELKKGNSIEILFYHHFTDNIYQVKDMEEKAKHWESILSKLIKCPEKKAA